MQLMMLIVVVPQNAAAAIHYGWDSIPEAGKCTLAACPLLRSMSSLPSVPEPGIMLLLPQAAAISG